MLEYCYSHGLNHVPVLFYGFASEFNAVDSFEDEEHWRNRFLESLIESYTEKDCYMCKNKVPEEGVVIVKEQEIFEPFKLKSFAFLERETKELDKGQENIDEG